jgi:hypothetical protein
MNKNNYVVKIIIYKKNKKKIKFKRWIPHKWIKKIIWVLMKTL